MEWKLFFATFAAIFVAELGDKTQLATFGAAAGAGAGRRLTVFAASALALVASSALAVLAGGWIGKHVPPHWLERAGGTIFVVLGVWFLWRSFYGPAPG